MAKTSPDIEHLARRGAEVRLRELVDEMKHLTAAYPHLRDVMSRDELPISFLLRKGATPPSVRKRGARKMSPAQRKAVSERMKKYWAARRKTAK